MFFKIEIRWSSLLLNSGWMLHKKISSVKISSVNLSFCMYLSLCISTSCSMSLSVRLLQYLHVSLHLSLYLYLWISLLLSLFFSIYIVLRDTRTQRKNGEGCITHIFWKAPLQFSHWLTPIGCCLLTDELNVEEWPLTWAVHITWSGATHNTGRYICYQVLPKQI